MISGVEPQSTTSTHEAELVKWADAIRSQCRILAERLALEGQRLETVKLIIEVPSVLFGLLSLAAGAAMLTGGQLLGGTSGYAVSVVTALLLIFSVVVDRVALRDPPQRFKDYSFYIERYAGQIDELLSSPQTFEQNEQLRQVCRLADINVADAKRHWPKLAHSVLAKEKELA